LEPVIEPQAIATAGVEQDTSAALLARIHARTAPLAVIGLGYVGLPLAMAFAEAGFQVTGLDVDEAKIAQLTQGRSHVTDVTDEEVRTKVDTGRFHPTSSFDALAACDCMVICVPTPLGKTREPDISAIIQTAEQIAPRLRAGQLVVLESTTYPGTTEEILLPRFEVSGLVVGKDYHLAFSPERIDPGNKQYGVRNIPKVVGGVTEECTRAARELYLTAVEHVFPVSSAKVAEMAKLLENTFRSVNIGLVNELALMCHFLGVDVWEVIAAADTKPFSFLAHYPGPGIGGHCIPLDPHYLAWKARLAGFEPKFIGLASEVNASMPRHVVQLTCDALNAHRKCLNGAKILILGVAYKPGVSDTRETPALAIMAELRRRGAEVVYNDPFVPHFTVGEVSLDSQELTEMALRSADCILIVTNHVGYDWDWVVRSAQLVVDTRNATKGIPVNGHTLFKL
jgi:UDP-N-acetyl-D-glucosamine dehydrogenase